MSDLDRCRVDVPRSIDRHPLTPRPCGAVRPCPIHEPLAGPKPKLVAYCRAMVPVMPHGVEVGTYRVCGKPRPCLDHDPFSAEDADRYRRTYEEGYARERARQAAPRPFFRAALGRAAVRLLVRINRALRGRYGDRP